MSIVYMGMVWASSAKDLAGSKRLIMLALADHMSDETHVCWPSVEHIGAKVGISQRQARRLLGELEEGGWISREEQEGRSTLYRIDQNRLILSARNENTPDNLSYTPDIAMSPEPSLTINNIPPTPQNGLRALFIELTGFMPPHETTDSYKDRWDTPLRQIEAAGDGEVRLRYAVDMLRRRGYVIASPKSVVTAALNWVPEEEREDTHAVNGAAQARAIHDMVRGYASNFRDYPDFEQAMHDAGYWDLWVGMGLEWYDVCYNYRENHWRDLYFRLIKEVKEHGAQET